VVQSPAGPGLLEREHELSLLQDAWRRAGTGRGSAWLVCAEAGGGKTRLLREATRGYPVRRGAAQPVVPPDPYLAVMQALRGFRPASLRVDSVERAVTCLERLAGEGSIAVVLDDLHFADEGTIAVFVRLAALCEARPWLILGAFRPGEGSQALRLAVTELVAQGSARRLDLPPLSRAGVAALVAGVRDHVARADEVDAIFAGSGGNPWFAETLARGAGAMSAARNRMLLRLDQLERTIPGAAGLLSALAPAGEPVPHAAAAALVGGDGGDLRRVLRGLRDAAVLREHDGAWQFRHELLRRSLFEDMLDADRRDAHRRLAEALEGHGTSATLAMHYAAAEDSRAAAWALRAAREASAIDAHTEALAQIERALSFLLDPEMRRTALGAAADAAWNLGRFADGRRLAEEGIAIPGGEPEVIALLRLRATKCARLLGDARGVDNHIDAAEQALRGRPVSDAMVRVAQVRLLRAAWRVEPEEVAATGDEAIRMARALGHRGTGAGYELEIDCYRGLSLLHAGDPAGLAPFERLIEVATLRPQMAHEVFTLMFNGYMIPVLSLQHAGADRFRLWLSEAMQRHNVEWEDKAGAYRVLELVQRGAFAEARDRLETAAAPAHRTMDHTVLLCARTLLEARAGSPARARALLDAADPPDDFAHTVLLDLARLEREAWTQDNAVAFAADVYARAAGRRFARAAGGAAVALAWAGSDAPSRPDWLVPASPLGVFWDWAGGIAARDAQALRAVAACFQEMHCPYEAALALRDAGDLQDAYRTLRALGATPAREEMARLLRAAGLPIPRGPRAGAGSAALTDTERVICRLVVEGGTNAAIAAELSIGVRTVEAHLGRIYQKTGRQGRVALATWWRERVPDEI